MKLKQRVEDFRVRELLKEEPRKERAPFRVYRVTKRKLTSVDAAAELARQAGAVPADVSMAGLKDRQGVTIQHMALEHGPVLSFKRPDLLIETVGYLPEALRPEDSEGNAFEVVVRGLDRGELGAIRKGLGVIREEGLVNYFDDQRFGNLRHGQGWIALDLARGMHEQALRRLLTASSVRDDRQRAAFKAALRKSWGDWAACRDAAGRFGAHHSVFEHLKREPGDFAGAFRHVATRVRLIHLYAFQSHLWNRAVAGLIRARTQPAERLVVSSEEGPLVFPGPGLSLALPATFRIPGPRLADVEDEEQRALLQDALASERLVPADFDIENVPGFALKGEDRPLIVRPQHLRVRPAEPDKLNRGASMVRVRFELPRGAYATLLVRRLAARSGPPPGVHAERERPGERGSERRDGARGGRGGARGGRRRDERPGRGDRQGKQRRTPR